MDKIVVGQKWNFEYLGPMGGTGVEGKIYHDPADDRLYYYSEIHTRSHPENGFFPIWNGKEKLISQYSNRRYLSEVISTKLAELSEKINPEVAATVRYLHRRSLADDILRPTINPQDNIFTQIVKGLILNKSITLVDLVDMSGLNTSIITNYYAALNKIAFMRMERWKIWISQIFHLNYTLSIYRKEVKLLTYHYPEDVFDCTGYEEIIESADDHLKKIVKLILRLENLSKYNLKSEETDDYTINNMMTTLISPKPFSAQLFSRFMRMVNLNYRITIYEHGKVIFEYGES